LTNRLRASLQGALEHMPREGNHPPTIPPPFARREPSAWSHVRRLFTMQRIIMNHRALTLSAIAAGCAICVCSVLLAQSNLTEPVYRVANETSAASGTTTATTAVATTPAAPATQQATAAALDFTRQGDEHPLQPVIRGLRASTETIDKSIRDYSCVFIKQERVEGQLNEKQYIAMKIMHDPFSVYMLFKQPFAGREVVYVTGANDGKLVALDVGVKRYLGKMPLDPNGALAMKGQKRPITSVGIRNLCEKLITLAEAECKFGECDVTTNANASIGGRKTTMVQIVHPTARQDFKHHVARIFFDNELRVPIHYDAFLWPTEAGGKPPLEESYTYQNLKVNNNFTARDFDAYNNPDIFKN
jgi:hypothetical protein